MTPRDAYLAKMKRQLGAWNHKPTQRARKAKEAGLKLDGVRATNEAARVAKLNKWLDSDSSAVNGVKSPFGGGGLAGAGAGRVSWHRPGMTDFPRTLKHITFWLLLGTAVFLALQAWQTRQRQSQFTAAGGVVELRRGPDGHFHWPGHVNGLAVEFLVDTGATRSALPQALAQAAGLVPERSVQSSTAGGTVQGWTGRADLALQGGLRVSRLPLTVLPALTSPLLGMDVLGKLSFSQADGVLRLRPPAP